MAAIELVTNHLGNYKGYEVYEPTGNTGNTYPDTSAWLSQKITAGITGITDVSTNIIVCNNNGLGWVAFDEPHPKGTIRTIFEIR